MHPYTILTVTLAVVVVVPADASKTDACVAAGTLNELVKAMPTSGLPPPIGIDLKYVLLGIGTQNYTCTSGKEEDMPDTVGAVGKEILLLYHPGQISIYIQDALASCWWSRF